MQYPLFMHAELVRYDTVLPSRLHIVHDHHKIIYRVPSLACFNMFCSFLNCALHALLLVLSFCAFCACSSKSRINSTSSSEGSTCFAPVISMSCDRISDSGFIFISIVRTFGIEEVGSTGATESVVDDSAGVVSIGNEAGEARCTERRDGPVGSSDRMTVIGIDGL